MKTFYSTIFTCIVVTLFGMSFISSENHTHEDHLIIKDECEECHALVDEFDLLAPPAPSECVPFSVYETLKESRDNYDPDDCYSLYSLLYNTISLWAYQANCQGPAFCEDILCQAKCMADCLRADAVYNGSTDYIITYLQNSCDCVGNECYETCGQEGCVTCPEDCCVQPDLIVESIPTDFGCCRIEVSSSLNPCCNVDIKLLDMDTWDFCIMDLSEQGSDVVVVEVCCLDDINYDPTIQIGAETLCDGGIRLNVITWQPRSSDFCE